MTRQLSIRREVVEYGSVPVSAWLQQADGIAAVHTLTVQLAGRADPDSPCTRLSICSSGQGAGHDQSKPWLCTGLTSISALAESLDVPLQHAEVVQQLCCCVIICRQVKQPSTMQVLVDTIEAVAESPSSVTQDVAGQQLVQRVHLHLCQPPCTSFVLQQVRRQ